MNDRHRIGWICAKIGLAMCGILFLCAMLLLVISAFHAGVIIGVAVSYILMMLGFIFAGVFLIHDTDEF
jgi:hypothetical protein